MIDLDIQLTTTTDQQIEKQIRLMIVQGKLLPGTKLPPVKDMARKWRVSCNSITKAMKRLAIDGFIESHPKLGAFVREPTSRGVIGILMGNSLTDESSFFCRSIYGKLRKSIESDNNRNWICRVYDNLSEARSKNDIPASLAYQNFIWDLKNYGFKGLVKLYGGLDKEEEVVLKDSLPRARFGVIPATSDLMLDFGDFARQSTKFILSRNVKNIAYVRIFQNWREGTSDLDAIKGVISASGKNIIFKTIQLENESTHPAGIQNLACEKISALIDDCKRSKGSIPEALLISDDIAAKGATMALLDKNIESLVVVMSNSGIEHAYGLPVVKYEFSTQEIAEVLIDILKKRIAGVPLPPLPIMIKGKIK